YLETGQTAEPYGVHPTGYLSYGRDCRMYAIIVREKRKPPAGVVPTDAEKLELFGGILAYAGTYTIEGDKVSPTASIFYGTRAGLAHRRQDQHGGGQRGTSGFSLDALRRSAGRFIEGATHDI